MVISACGKSPTAPEPPPVPVIEPPAQSYVQVVSTSPQAGATLKATVVDDRGFVISGDKIYLTLKYAMSDADWVKTRERGEKVIVSACLSVDGVTVVEVGCSGRNASIDGKPGENVQSGQLTGLDLLVPARSGVKQTNYIILYLMWRPNDSSLRKPDEAFYQNPVQMVFKWE
ncbi:MAG: hypothetical protein NUV78_01525 [Candidatus Zambryskibacteria bacterium]|nr:hypothetical protein [Candidatus Zambryskibacteria bacterium]